MRITKRTQVTKLLELLALAVAVSLPASLWGQFIEPAAKLSAACTPDPPGLFSTPVPADSVGWHPTGVDKSPGLSEAKAKAGIALLNQVDRTMRAIPALNPAPAGIQLTVREGVGEERENLPGAGLGANGLLRLQYAVDFHHVISLPNNKSALDDAGGGYGIFFNRFESLRFGDKFAPRKVGEFRGYPVFQFHYFNFLLMTKRSSLPWVQVTVREYAEERLKDLERNAPPAAASQQLRDSYELEHAKFKQKLASLSPAELDAPVYVDHSKEGHGYNLEALSTAGDPKAETLAHLNKGFLDPSLPLTAVQFITIGFRLDYSKSHCAFTNLESAIHKQLDFKLLEAMLQ